MNLRCFFTASVAIAGLFLSLEVNAQSVGDPLVELFLSARTSDDRLIEPNANGIHQLNVREPFDLEISYDDLRVFPEKLGAFQIRTDLSLGQPGFLEPVLQETQKIVFGRELFDLPSNTTGTFTFTLENSGKSYVTNFQDFSQRPFSEVHKAMSSFGYTADQYELSSPTGIGNSFGFQIHYLGDDLADLDVPDIFVESDFSIDVPVFFVEVLPRNPDGSINNAALALNLNSHSRTFGDNEEFYRINKTGIFDPAIGFTNLGGIGGIPSQGGGIPQLSGDGTFVTPFDAFSIRVQFVKPVANFVIDLKPNVDSEAVLLYGQLEAFPNNLIRTDENARLVFTVGVPEPSSSLLGVVAMLVVLGRRHRPRVHSHVQQWV